MEAKKTVRVNKKALRAAARRRAAAAARFARTRLVLRDAGRPRVEKLKVWMKETKVVGNELWEYEGFGFLTVTKRPLNALR